MEGPIPVDQLDQLRLFEAAMEAKEAILEARRKLAAIAPHGRNYPLGSFSQAAERHVVIGELFEAGLNYADELLENLDAYN